MTTALMLLLGIVLTAGTFVFVSAEFSLVAVDQAVLEKKAEEGDRGAASVLRATRTLSTQLHDAERSSRAAGGPARIGRPRVGPGDRHRGIRGCRVHQRFLDALR